MKDFTDQAIKNGVILLNKGNCQFCGAEYQRGIFECMENFNNGLDLLDFNNADYHVSKFLRVDAHALQHPEIHGRWNNHFHLTRLNLIRDKKVVWDYNKSPLLSSFLNGYKQNKQDEIFTPPQPFQRGIITVKDLAKATTANECVELINDWANEVYQTWFQYHSVVSQIADDFLANYYKSNSKKNSR